MEEDLILILNLYIEVCEQNGIKFMSKIEHLLEKHNLEIEREWYQDAAYESRIVKKDC